MSVAFGVTPQFRQAAPPPIVKAIDREAPIRPRRRFSPWTIAEDDVVRERAHLGVAEIHKVIPHRSPSAILQHAQDIKVRIKRKVKPGFKHPSRRGNKPIPRHCHPMVRTYIAELNRLMLTWEEAERLTGVGTGTLRSWSFQTVPKLDTFIAALNVVGLDLAVVVKGQATSL